MTLLKISVALWIILHIQAHFSFISPLADEYKIMIESFQHRFRRFLLVLIMVIN